MAADSRESIKVVCRFRPLNKVELVKGGKCCITSQTEEAVTLTTSDATGHTFSFDRIYGTSSAQADVYEYAAAPIVEALFQGFNGCLLAYGQTGSGASRGRQQQAQPPLLHHTRSSSRCC